MWVSTVNGRKSNKENSLDKIRQYLKLTEKSSYSSSFAKSSPFSASLCLLQERKFSNEQKVAKDRKQNASYLKQIRNSLPESKVLTPSSSILSNKINFSRSRVVDAERPPKVLMTSLATREEERCKSQIKSPLFLEADEELPYFIQCMSKKHRLLGEMLNHLQSSIMTFKEFLKHCEIHKFRSSSFSYRPQSDGNMETERHRKTIIFDMDETLIHTDEAMTPYFEIKVPFKSFQGKTTYGYVNVRPYAKQLLQRLSRFFDIVVFTASSQCYADPILDHIDPHNVIQKRLYREHCTLIKNQVYVKDLRILNRRLDSVVLVDNAPYSYMMQLANGIPILSYYRGKEDNQLYRLEEYLMGLRNVKDVRLINMEYFALHEYVKYDSHEKIISNIYSRWFAR